MNILGAIGCFSVAVFFLTVTLISIFHSLQGFFNPAQNCEEIFMCIGGWVLGFVYVGLFMGTFAVFIQPGWLELGISIISIFLLEKGIRFWKNPESKSQSDEPMRQVPAGILLEEEGYLPKDIRDFILPWIGRFTYFLFNCCLLSIALLGWFL